MTALTIEDARKLVADNGQGHVLRFWGDVGETQRAALLEQVAAVDFALMKRLIEQWVRNEPLPEQFTMIEPVPLIPKIDLARADAREAYQAGEEALRAVRVPRSERRLPNRPGLEEIPVPIPRRENT